MPLELPTLAIVPALPRILDSLAHNHIPIVIAPPGTGKSTVLPLALLEESWLPTNQKIALLEPRRVAAASVAARMAELCGEVVGETVGVRMRFVTQVSKATRLEVMTEGTLMRILQNDPELRDYGCIILDEVHERSLITDCACAFLREVREAIRPDLRIVILSATVDPEVFLNFFDGAEVIALPDTENRSVTIHYRAPIEEGLMGARVFHPETVGARVAAGVLEALSQYPGDVLAFLPGRGELAACERHLVQDLPVGIRVVPFHGGLSIEQQKEVTAPRFEDAGRRVVLATSIAETSLTVAGVRVVVDSGLARTMVHDSGTGFSRLVTTRVSKDAADQRAGRAGRLGPGHAIRLWSPRIHDSLADFRPPEIRNADLASLYLDTLVWGAQSPASMSWLEAPPAGAIAEARLLMERIGAVDREKGTLTELGSCIARIGSHPRFAALALAAQERAELKLIAAALLTFLENGSGKGRDSGDNLVDGVAAIINS